MKNFKIKNVKLAFVILIILALILTLLYYYFIFSPSLARLHFANQMVELSDGNENSIFTVQKVLLYSSANAIDHTKNQSLQNMSIDQYTDLSIFIDNSQSGSELTDENTIRELYIDNIHITSNSDKGSKVINYKNPTKFGEYLDIDNCKNDRIDFNIVNTNQENESNDYDKPTFYTDCSNPIALGYINKDILNNYSVSADASTVSFNGKVLKEANIDINDINYALEFTIHIVNNLNQKFSYRMKIDVNLDSSSGSIYNGYTYTGTTLSGNEYRFFRELN